MAQNRNAAQGWQLRVPKTYKDTDSYHALSKSEHKLLTRYRKDADLSDEDLRLQFWEMDLEAVPENQAQRAAAPGQMIVLVFAILGLGCVNSGEVAWVVLGLLMIVAGVVLYMTGLLNPLTSQSRKLKKDIKKRVGDYTFQKFLEMER